MNGYVSADIQFNMSAFAAEKMKNFQAWGMWGG
jgi:hypothetical protein